MSEEEAPSGGRAVGQFADEAKYFDDDDAATSGVRQLQDSILVEQLEKTKAETEQLVMERDGLKKDLITQREDEADVYYYLHKKLDDNYDVIAGLEKQILTEQAERERQAKRSQRQYDELESSTSSKIKTLTSKLGDAEKELENLVEFKERKEEIERQHAEMLRERAEEKEAHRSTVEELDRKIVREKERAEKLLATNKKLAGQRNALEIELQLSQEQERELAKRTQFYQKLIKKLHEKLRGREEADAARVGQEQEEGLRLESLTEANQAVITALQQKCAQLERNLEDVCVELERERGAKRALLGERERMLSLQDDTVRALLAASEPAGAALSEREREERAGRGQGQGDGAMQALVGGLLQKYHTFQAAAAAADAGAAPSSVASGSGLGSLRGTPALTDGRTAATGPLLIEGGGAFAAAPAPLPLPPIGSSAKGAGAGAGGEGGPQALLDKLQSGELGFAGGGRS
eukprot:g3090.t1